MAIELLKRREAWIHLRVAGMLVFLNVFLYLAAVVSPGENTRDMPVALVNEDVGAVSPGGGTVDLGGEVVEGVLSSPRSGEAVKWIRLGTREEALEGIRKGDLYGALVVPRDYSGRLVDLARLAAERPGGSTDGPIRPAEIEILTNPAAGPTVSNAVQGFTSGAAGTDKAKGGRICSGIGLPPLWVTAVCDRVRGQRMNPSRASRPAPPARDGGRPRPGPAQACRRCSSRAFPPPHR